MTVRIVPSEHTAPPDKVADAELVFDNEGAGLLAGLKLVGFSIWRSRRRSILTVTFPARQFVVNGERRSYALLRPVAGAASTDALRLVILQAFAEYEQRGVAADMAAEAAAAAAAHQHGAAADTEGAEPETAGPGGADGSSTLEGIDRMAINQ